MDIHSVVPLELPVALYIDFPAARLLIPIINVCWEFHSVFVTTSYYTVTTRRTALPENGMELVTGSNTGKSYYVTPLSVSTLLRLPTYSCGTLTP
jgi:hypothetical protein